MMRAMIVIATLLISACATYSPVNAGCGTAKGQTLETCAYAMYGSLAIAEQQAAVLVQSDQVPPWAKDDVRKVDLQVSAVLERVHPLITALQTAATANNTAAVNQATTDLQAWVTAAQTQLNTLNSTIKGAPSP